MQVSDNPYIHLGSSDISETSPCGENAKYDPEFEALEAELAKTESLTSESADWPTVVNLSTSILQNKSKDLLVASYLCRGLVDNYGYAGLAVGLSVINDLVQQRWEGMFPPIKRARARASALTWLAEKNAVVLAEMEAQETDAEAIDIAYSKLKEIDGSVAEHMADQAPQLHELLRLLKGLRQQFPFSETEASPETTEAPAPQTTPAEASPPPQPSATETTPPATAEASSAPAAASPAAEEGEAQLEHALINLGLDAIPGDAPAGINAKYEPEFEQLEAEVGKSESLAGEAVEWSLVERYASEILKNKSKDLLVAAYLVRALWEGEKYRGLCVGLKIINDIVSNYWDDCFPPAKRLRARATALQWMSEKCANLVEESEPQTADKPYVDMAYDLIRDILDTMADKMGEQAPSLHELSKPLKQYRQQLKAAAAEPPPAPAPAAEPTPAPQAAPAAVPEPTAAKPAEKKEKKAAASSGAAAAVDLAGAIEKDADAKKLLRQVQDACRAVSKYWGAKKDSDPKPFRLNRVALWMTIDQLPAATEGRTQIGAPQKDTVNQFITNLEEGNYAKVLPVLENFAIKQAFWMDGHRMVYECLANMGDDYTGAATAVRNEVAGLLIRLPDIAEYTFADGTPFADEATREWLAGMSAPAEGGGQDSGESVDTPAMRLQKLLAEIGKQLKTDQPLEALEAFNAELAHLSSRAERFEWQLKLASVLADSKLVDVAVGKLVGMHQELTEFRLEEWQKDLAVDYYMLLYRLLKGKSPKEISEDEKKLHAHAFASLCTIAPQQAITLKGEK